MKKLILTLSLFSSLTASAYPVYQGYANGWPQYGVTPPACSVTIMSINGDHLDSLSNENFNWNAYKKIETAIVRLTDKDGKFVFSMLHEGQARILFEEENKTRIYRNLKTGVIDQYNIFAQNFTCYFANPTPFFMD